MVQTGALTRFLSIDNRAVEFESAPVCFRGFVLPEWQNARVYLALS